MDQKLITETARKLIQGLRKEQVLAEGMIEGIRLLLKHISPEPPVPTTAEKPNV